MTYVKLTSFWGALAWYTHNGLHSVFFPKCSGLSNSPRPGPGILQLQLLLEQLLHVLSEEGVSLISGRLVKTLNRLLHVLLVCQSRAGEVQECLLADRLL